LLKGVWVVGVAWPVGTQCCLLDSFVEHDGEALVGFGADLVVVDDVDLREERLVADPAEVVVEAHVEGVSAQEPFAFGEPAGPFGLVRSAGRHARREGDRAGH
jgi:hypothetical protein